MSSYHDVSFLFTTTNSLLWRATGLLAPCSFRKPLDQSFCSPMKAASLDLYESTAKANEYLKSLQDKFAGNEEIMDLFYSPEILYDVYPGCSEDSTITVTVDRVKFPDYEGFPPELANGETYTVHEKEVRCNDEYHPDEKGPYELILPEEYSAHFTRGIGNTLRVYFQYAYALAQTPGYNLTTAPPGPISKYSYFNLFEATEEEVMKGIEELKGILKSDLLKEYSSSRTAFNATYIVSIVYVLGLFAWAFESSRRDLAREIQNNRGIIFMIPVSVVAKSKPIVEYVERTLTELIG